MSYTDVFGGNVIYPSDVSYLRLDLVADVVLDWPQDRTADTPAARIIDLAPTGAFSVTLPPADETGVGQTLLFNNLGPNTVLVLDSTGGTVLSLAAGEVWQIYLINTSTPAGVWRTFRYGASTAQAQASALAGQGLLATGSTLSQQYPVTEFNSNFAAGASDRAATFVWVGANGTLTLPAAASAGNGWFVSVRNTGTGLLTIDPNGTENINGAPTLTMQPEDSATLVSTGAQWYTIGLGQDPVFAFDYTSIDLTGQSSPYTLSGAELNRIAYKFVGTLASNMQIIVPPTVQQYWVDNGTTGPFTLGIRTLAQAVPLNVQQGARGIYYSDGNAVVAADTAGIAVPIAVSAGGTGSTTAGGALVNLGGSSLGISLFTAVSTAAVWTALGRAPAGTVDGGAF